jgi:hypothetical protein
MLKDREINIAAVGCHYSVTQMTDLFHQEERRQHHYGKCSVKSKIFLCKASLPLSWKKDGKGLV